MSIVLKPSVILFLLFWGFMPFAAGQVVNIESKRMRTDSVRWSGFGDLGISFSENDDRTLFKFNADAGLQWKSKSLKTIVLFLTSYTTSRSRDVDFVDILFGHLRWNHSLSKLFRWEAFQQYQSNPPLGIKARSLSGTGPRMKFLNKEHLAGYLGTHYMYELEVQKGTGVTLHQHRSSSYVSFSLFFPKWRFEFVTTTYYQPIWGKASDFRFSTENQLMVNITKNLSWNGDFHFFYDAVPPEGIRKRALALSQGLKYQF